MARWKALKKDARTLAGQQLLRLELAMAQRRRWSADEFRQCFVEHPLMRHLARRLLWAEFVDGRIERCLRVAEDLSYADANDNLLSLPDTAEVGLAHALELPPADAAAFGQIFADYEILQPFAQIGREVYRLDDSERAFASIARFSGRKVAILLLSFAFIASFADQAFSIACNMLHDCYRGSPSEVRVPPTRLRRNPARR